MTGFDYDVIRPLFSGRLTQGQVNGIETILAGTEGLPREHRAYLLATAYHETATRMQPIKETVMPHHSDTKPSDATVVSRLERAWEQGRLKWVKVPYWRFDQTGNSWFGRGLVQITHRDNYAKAGLRLNVDLLGDPNRALNPEVSTRILVRGCCEGWFTGKKLDDYLPGDYVGARRVVNGTDRAQEIAAYARTFEMALPRQSAVPAAPATAPAGWARLVAFLASIFGRKA